MSFLFGGSRQQAPAAPPPAPQPAPAPTVATVLEAAGDAPAQAEKKKALRRRGRPTVLSGEETVLGATSGKTLLGA